jgi:hypothetical protein
MKKKVRRINVMLLRQLAKIQVQLKSLSKKIADNVVPDRRKARRLVAEIEADLANYEKELQKKKIK